MRCKGSDSIKIHRFPQDSSPGIFSFACRGFPALRSRAGLSVCPRGVS
jgi:hypothetical protein